jgi:phage gp36-like protein
MAYTNLANLIKAVSEDRLIELTDDNDTGVVDTDVIDDVLDQVEELISSKISGRYTTPLADPVPKLIVSVANDLAIYELHKRRLNLDMPESLEQQRKNAMKILDDIRKKALHLSANELAVTTDTSGHAGLRASDRVFDDETLSKY